MPQSVVNSHALIDGNERLGWLATAEASYRQRAHVSLDEFVALGDDVSGDDYRAWFATNFGIQL